VTGREKRAIIRLGGRELRWRDASDCGALHVDLAFKVAVGQRPEGDADLCSQSTMCRLENLPGRVALNLTRWPRNRLRVGESAVVQAPAPGCPRGSCRAQQVWQPRPALSAEPDLRLQGIELDRSTFLRSTDS
jgi:hypothetical protein